MWYVCGMENYSAVKNNDTLKWMELEKKEKPILSDITQTQKDEYVYSLIRCFKARSNQHIAHNSREPRQQRRP